MIYSIDIVVTLISRLMLCKTLPIHRNFSTDGMPYSATEQLTNHKKYIQILKIAKQMPLGIHLKICSRTEQTINDPVCHPSLATVEVRSGKHSTNFRVPEHMTFVKSLGVGSPCQVSQSTAYQRLRFFL